MYPGQQYQQAYRPSHGYPAPPQQYAPPPYPQQQGYGPPMGSPMQPPPVQQHYPPPPPSGPPPYPGPDPQFTQQEMRRPNPNYPQPPNTQHNQRPNPVPYGPLPQGGTSDFVMHVHPAMQGGPPPQFQLSNCQGRKRALLIGINYFNTSNELRGCINDVHAMKRFLIGQYGFRECDMVILTDDNPDFKFQPTRTNMISAMHWLVHDARPNDSFFFHYSGHGGRTKDLDGDEDDGYDETIYPVDHQQVGMIVDDEMHAIMVRPLPPGCRLTAIFDSCHSGTALDLPYVYTTSGTIKEKNIFKDAGSSLLNAGLAYATGNIGGLISSFGSLGNTITNSGRNMEQIRQQKSSPADVIMFSGCKDSQTSADASEAGTNTGAMSYAFITCLSHSRNQSYQILLSNIRNVMQGRYTQRPQLSSSHPMDMNLLFVC